MKVIEMTKKKVKTRPKQEVKDMIEKQRKEDERLVKGMFEFTEAEGGWFEFSYRIYPGEPIQVFNLIHGEICEIPMGIVKHLNNCKKKIKRYRDVASAEQAPNGKVRLPTTFETVSRVRFTPSEYL